VVASVRDDRPGPAAVAGVGRVVSTNTTLVVVTANGAAADGGLLLVAVVTAAAPAGEVVAVRAR
jgi:hypothetical protein